MDGQMHGGWSQGFGTGARARGLEPGPGDWSQGLGVGVKAQGLEPGPGGWRQGLGAGARVWGLESGSGAGARVWGLEPGPGGWSQGPGARARAWGLGEGREDEKMKKWRNGETKKIALCGIIGHRPLRGRCPKGKWVTVGKLINHTFYRDQPQLCRLSYLGAILIRNISTPGMCCKSSSANNGGQSSLLGNFYEGLGFVKFS